MCVGDFFFFFIIAGLKDRVYLLFFFPWSFALKSHLFSKLHGLRDGAGTIWTMVVIKMVAMTPNGVLGAHRSVSDVAIICKLNVFPIMKRFNLFYFDPNRRCFI